MKLRFAKDWLRRRLENLGEASIDDPPSGLMACSPEIYAEMMKMTTKVKIELVDAHQPVVVEVADRVPAASVHDDFVAWQCEKCGRYHHKHFPDEGCDWCSGAAISKRLGLSAAAIPQPAQDAKCPYVVTSGEGTSHCRLAEQAAQDAARYRWWRENGYLAVANGDCLDANEVLFAGTEMDEYTDAAMAKESGR